MGKYTRFTNLEVTDELKIGSMKASTSKVTAADVAAAAYIMADHIAPGQIEALDGELHELLARADSQCIDVPRGVEQAQLVLRRHELPVWPHIEVASIVRQAARITVDQGMFVPARTLSVAAARMNEGEDRGIDVIQAQFIRSLSA